MTYKPWSPEDLFKPSEKHPQGATGLKHSPPRSRRSNEMSEFDTWWKANGIEAATYAEKMATKKGFVAGQESLRQQVALYEQALLASWPEGAKGVAFDFWNAARKLAATKEQ